MEAADFNAQARRAVAYPLALGRGNLRDRPGQRERGQFDPVIPNAGCILHGRFYFPTLENLVANPEFHPASC
jgi:hypothetical protein